MKIQGKQRIRRGVLGRAVASIDRARHRAYLEDGTELPIVEAIDKFGRQTLDLFAAVTGIAQLKPGIAWQIEFAQFRASREAVHW